MNKSILNALFSTALFLIVGGAETKAQILLSDEPALETQIFSNKKNGLFKFQGITEKHNFQLNAVKDANELITSIKKDERVLSADFNISTRDLVIVVLKKEYKTSEYWLLPIIEKRSIKVNEHTVKHFYSETK